MAKKIAQSYLWYILFWYMLIGFISLGLNSIFDLGLHIHFAEEGTYNFLIYPLQKNFHNNSLFLVAWFLFAYVLVTAIFKIQITLLQNKIADSLLRKLTMVWGLLLGWLCINFLAPLYTAGNSEWYCNLLCQLGVGYCFMSIGYFLRKYLAWFGSITFSSYSY